MTPPTTRWRRGGANGVRTMVWCWCACCSTGCCVDTRMLSILGLGWHGPSVQLESGESGLYPGSSEVVEHHREKLRVIHPKPRLARTGLSVCRGVWFPRRGRTGTHLGGVAIQSGRMRAANPAASPPLAHRSAVPVPQWRGTGRGSQQLLSCWVMGRRRCEPSSDASGWLSGFVRDGTELAVLAQCGVGHDAPPNDSTTAEMRSRAAGGVTALPAMRTRSRRLPSTT